MRFLLFAALVLCTFLGGCATKQPLDTTMPQISYLDRAKYQRQIGNIDEAIKLYRLYIAERLKKVDRLQEEDPNYYLIVIGDLLFDSKRVEEAYVVYEEAEQRGVAKNFVIDRYVRTARWYQSRKNFAMAECILTKHSFLDPLVFEGELDQSFRKHTAAEDALKRRIPGGVNMDICNPPVARMPTESDIPVPLVAPKGGIK